MTRPAPELMTLADALMEEISRVRDEILPNYITAKALMPSASAGIAFSIAIMRRELDMATRSLAEGDAAACARCLESLRGYTR